MTFDGHHYVPVLKVKRGEKQALRAVRSSLRSRITPLLEIVERKADKTPTVDAHLNTAFKGLADSVAPYARCFLDARELAAGDPMAAAEVFQRAASAGITFTPVTGMSRDADMAAALAHQAHGIALRLTRAEYEKGNLAESLHAFVATHALTPEGTDLIIDIGAVDDMIAEGVATLAGAFLAEVPDQQRWRTLTVSGCAFPSSIGTSVVARDSHTRVERSEWIAWRDRLHARRNSLARLPAFSDCAIQHPTGVEGFDPRIMQVSASIRYALPDAWLLIKGHSTRTTRPTIQFPQLATRLVYGRLRTEYSGAEHCGGCESMQAAADHADGFGSPEVWRRLGTIHHISMVMQELASLPWP